MGTTATPKLFVARQRDFKDGTSKFEAAIKTALGAGNVQFVEDWSHYHLGLGEVHCGSNVLRTPYSIKWWENQP